MEYYGLSILKSLDLAVVSGKFTKITDPILFSIAREMIRLAMQSDKWQDDPEQAVGLILDRLLEIFKTIGIRGASG